MIDFAFQAAKKQHEELCKTINFHDIHYWVLEHSIIGDSQYDGMVRDLQAIEAKYPQLLTPESPSCRRAGSLLEGFKEVPHIDPMRSLAKTFVPEELAAKIDKIAADCRSAISWTVEPKVDGLTLDLRYEDGILVRALTGGDGFKGSDVTANARTIRSIPIKLGIRPGTSCPKVVHVRGEAYMTFTGLEALNLARKKAGEALLANPRNAAGGAMRLLDPKETSKRKLCFMAFSAKNMDSEGRGMVWTQDASLSWLRFMGFSTVEHTLCNNSTDVIEAVNKFGFRRKNLPYPTDGAVIKMNQLALESEFPGTREVQGNAFAYKYAPDQTETVINSITIQVGRSGRLTPVAELQPVSLAGSVIERASLHNADWIKEKDIRVGDTVVLQKAGEIIPEIVSVVLSERSPVLGKPYIMPETCPSCGSTIYKQMLGDGEEGSAFVCPNEKCKGRLASHLEYWCKALEMDDMGPVMATNLVNSEKVQSIPDLYDLRFDTLAHYGVQIAEKLLSEIEASKQAGMEAVLVGFGIPRIGGTISRKAAIRFTSVNEFFNAVTSSAIPFSTVWPDFGAANLKSITEWVNKNQWMVTSLEDKGVSMKSKTYNPGAAAGPFAGKTFVFTGTLAMERSAAQRLVESNGGKATGSVSKKTSYVVVGVEPGNNKLEGAKKHGVPILNEEQFMKLVENLV